MDHNLCGRHKWNRKLAQPLSFNFVISDKLDVQYIAHALSGECLGGIAREFCQINILDDSLIDKECVSALF